MTWEQIDIVPGIGGADALLSGLSAAAKGTRALLEPVLTALDALKPIVGIAASSSYDLSLLSDFLTDVAIVHLYPSQAYMAMRLGLWARTLEKSFEASNISCITFPAQLQLYVISSESVTDLLDAANKLRAFWGYDWSGFEDVPKTIDRVKTRIKTTECTSLLDEIPHLRELRPILEAELTISVPNPLATLFSSVQDKIDALEARVQLIDDFLEVLESFDLPTVYKFTQTVDSVSTIAETIVAYTGGPDTTTLVAGTGILMNPATGAAVNLALGG